MNSPNAQKYSDAIQDALMKVSEEVGGGDMNAALGALVASQAYLIAGIAERRYRRLMVAECAKTLPEQVAAQLRRGASATTQVIEIKGGLN